MGRGPGLDGERETQIVAHNLNNSKPVTGYKTWLSNNGLSGKDVVIAICDTGVDVNQNNNTGGHSDLRGRQIKFIDYTDGRVLTDTDGHGTHVAGICLGNAGSDMKEGNPPEDFLWGQGMAPDAKYVTQNALFGSWPPSDFGNLTRDAVSGGANIMNNSWYDGGPPGSGYTENARRFDQLCRDPTGDPIESDLKNLIIVFSAGNEGPRDSTITPPHEAKNPIIVGNSSTYRPNTGNNDIRGLARRSSRGPAKDHRILPTIVAPGTNVSSAYSNTSARIPIPDTDGKYIYLSGTSMAAPHISGCCALLVEWWKKRTN
jgi:subtilisin family serine protease